MQKMDIRERKNYLVGLLSGIGINKNLEEIANEYRETINNCSNEEDLLIQIEQLLDEDIIISSSTIAEIAVIKKQYENLLRIVENKRKEETKLQMETSIEKVNTNKIVEVDFNGGKLEAIMDENGDVWTSVRRICDALGIDSNGQQQRLRDVERSPWSNTCVIHALDISGRNFEQFFIHLDSLPMWLANISPKRISKETRPMLIKYQLEAAKVLRDYFFGAQQNRLVLPEMSSKALEVLLGQVKRAEVAELERNEVKEQLLLSETTVQEMKPFAEVGKAIEHVEVCLLGDFAKSIMIDGYVMGRNSLFKYLRDIGVLYKENGQNKVKQKYINSGYFIMKQGSYWNSRTGKSEPTFTPVITGKGQSWLIKKMKKDPNFKNKSIKVKTQ